MIWFDISLQVEAWYQKAVCHIYSSVWIIVYMVDIQVTHFLLLSIFFLSVSWSCYFFHSLSISSYLFQYLSLPSLFFLPSLTTSSLPHFVWCPVTGNKVKSKLFCNWYFCTCVWWGYNGQLRWNLCQENYFLQSNAKEDMKIYTNWKQRIAKHRWNFLILDVK